MAVISKKYAEKLVAAGKATLGELIDAPSIRFANPAYRFREVLRQGANETVRRDYYPVRIK